MDLNQALFLIGALTDTVRTQQQQMVELQQQVLTLQSQLAENSGETADAGRDADAA